MPKRYKMDNQTLHSKRKDCYRNNKIGTDKIYFEKDLKQSLKRIEKRINKTYCKDCGNNPMKIIKEEMGEGLLE